MNDANSSVPPIPISLADRATIGGLVVPAITPCTADGRYLLGAIERTIADRAINERLCGVCVQPHRDRCVLLMRATDLSRKRTSEPALHPVCSAYTVKACPMVAGRMRSTRANPHQLDSTLHRVASSDERWGAPAQPWFAVWVDGYDVIEEDGTVTASYADREPLRIRPVGQLGAMLSALRSLTQSSSPAHPQEDRPTTKPLPRHCAHDPHNA